MTTVINIKVENLRRLGYPSLEEWLKNPNHIYIGRNMGYVKGATKSFWHNPYKVSSVLSREEAICEYLKYIINSPEHINRLSELQGKVLGCWCKPEECHGDVLCHLVNNM